MGALENKVAVITGSTRGLGLAIARAYAREGASVIVTSRSAKDVEAAITDLTQQGARVSGIATDVGDLAQVTALAQHAVATFGRIDIWFNNAGKSGPYGPTAAIDPTDFERVIRTNIFGVYYGSLVAIQQFQSQNSSGKLINTLGRGDTEPVKYQNAYASSKAWVRNFTLALAKEYEKTGIGIYAFNPGLVDTDLLRKLEAIEGYEQKLNPLSTVMRLWANPPVVPAERAVWLASAATDSKTGLELRVLGRREIFAGLLRDLRRKLTRQPAPDTSLHITALPPYHLF